MPAILFVNDLCRVQRAILFCSLFFLLAAATQAQNANQWRALAPLEGGSISFLASAEGRVYAASATRGLFASGDNGKTWQPANRGFENQSINALIAIDGAVLVAANNLYRSTDGGQTWTNLGNTVQFPRALAHSGNNLLAITSAGRAFLSTDKGLTWTARGNLPAGASARALAMITETALVMTFSGLLRSPDLGMTWSTSTSGLPNNGAPLLYTVAANAGKFYAGTLFYGTFPNLLSPVWVSSDNAQTWTAFGNALSFNFSGTPNFATPNALSFDGNKVIAATAAGIAVSEGGDWSEWQAGNGYPIGLASGALLRTSEGLYCGTDSGGVFRFANDGTSWQISNTGLQIANVRTVTTNAQYLFAGLGGAGVMRSADNGQSWIPLKVQTNLGRPIVVSKLVTQGAKVFAASQDSGVYFSSDNGITWEAVNRGFFLPSLFIFDLIAARNQVYCLQGAGFYSFNESSKEWATPNLGPTGGTKLAVTDNVIYTTNSGAVRRSTDDGFSFQPVTVPEINLLGQLAARGKQVFVSGFVTGSGSTSSRIAMSNDEGLSYQLTRAAFSATGFEFKDENVYASGIGGFYFSPNGMNWLSANSGLPSATNLNALTVRGDTVFAATSGFGIYAAEKPHTQIGALANTNAASYNASALAPASIATVFGEGLATTTQTAAQTPLPTTLAGTRIVLSDGAGNEVNAPLIFVSPTQINYLVPPAAANGAGAVTVISGANRTSFGTIQLASVAPGLFAANANGQGVASALALRIKADGSQSYEALTEFDAATNRFVARPLDLGPASDQVFLILFGTGLRQRSSLSTVAARLGGLDAEVLFAGAQAEFIGVDQINLRIPRALAGRGTVEINLTIEGKAVNTLQFAIR